MARIRPNSQAYFRRVYLAEEEKEYQKTREYYRYRWGCPSCGLNPIGISGLCDVCERRRQEHHD